jgi:hypothetical protein
MRGRDSGDVFALAANQNDEGLTFNAIERNAWNAVDRPLPDDADRSLLERTAFAAGECARAAFAAARVAEITQPDLAPAYQSRSSEAADRDQEARHRLGRLPGERISKVSPFLDLEQLRIEALRNVMIEVASEQRTPYETVTAATIEANPWSIIGAVLKGVEPELLRRVQDTARGLVLDAWERRDGSYSPEEASLWDRYAGAARSTYAEAEVALARAAAMQRDGLVLTAEPLMVEAIARDRWKAIELDIPEDASRGLLSLIAETARDLGRSLASRGNAAVRGDDAAEFFALAEEAEKREKNAEARLVALGTNLRTEAEARSAATSEAGEVRDAQSGRERDRVALSTCSEKRVIGP